MTTSRGARIEDTSYALLLELALSLAEASDFEALSRDVVPKLKYMMDFNRCTVALLDETETTYRLLTLLETRPEMFRTSEDHFSLDRGISAKAILNGEPCVWHSRDRNEVNPWPIADEAMEGGSLKSVMCLPLQVSGKAFGAIAFGTDQAVGYGRADVSIAAMIAMHVALAIDRWNMFEKLRSANEEIQKRTAELEAFSYSVSHDLRAPLRAIDGFSRILSEDYGERLDPECNRLLSTISRNTRKMGQLIDDLLEFSRLGRQEMRLVEVDMAELAKTVFDDLKTIVPERVISFDVRALPPSHADRNLIHQVVLPRLEIRPRMVRPYGSCSCCWLHLKISGCVSEHGRPIPLGDIAADRLVPALAVGFDARCAVFGSPLGTPQCQPQTGSDPCGRRGQLQPACRRRRGRHDRRASVAARRVGRPEHRKAAVDASSRPLATDFWSISPVSWMRREMSSSCGWRWRTAKGGCLRINGSHFALASTAAMLGLGGISSANL